MMQPVFLNPLESIRNEDQHLSWKHLKESNKPTQRFPNRKEIEYDLELIMPFKGPVTPFADTAYWTVAAYVHKRAECNVLFIEKGQVLVLDIPIRTFESAWRAVSSKFRKSLDKNSNLRIKFHKKSKQCMYITHVEECKCSKEHETFALRVYQEKSSKNQKKSPLIRGSEAY